MFRYRLAVCSGSHMSSLAVKIRTRLKCVASNFSKYRQFSAKCSWKVCAISMQDYTENTDFVNKARNVEFERPCDSISKPLRSKNSSAPW